MYPARSAGYDLAEAAASRDSREGEFPQDVDDWNDRVADAKRILKALVNSSGGDYNAVYTVMGLPVGIISLTTGDPCEVDWLLSHPGVDGAGGTLMELACDWSRSSGAGGRLELLSFSGKSTKVYRAMGFTKDDNDYDGAGTMTLQ